MSRNAKVPVERPRTEKETYALYHSLSEEDMSTCVRPYRYRQLNAPPHGHSFSKHRHHIGQRLLFHGEKDEEILLRLQGMVMLTV